MELFSPKAESHGAVERVDAERELKDIRKLNPRRVMGYFPIDQLKAYSTVEEEMEIAKEKGYKYLVAPHASIGSEGAFYVYDDARLQGILDAYHGILEKYGWPVEAEGFVYKVSEAWIDDDERADLRAVIEKAFGRT